MKIKAENKSLRKQAGYTLIELSISVAIIAVLVMTGLYGVPRILDANKVTTLTQQVTLATANYSKIAAQTAGTLRTFSDSTATGNVASLGQMGVWPDEALVKGTTGAVTKITHPFDGGINSKSNTIILTNMAADEGYFIRLDSVPLKNCFAITSAFLNTAVTAWVVNNDANYTEPSKANVENASTSPKVPGGAVSLTNLATQCVGAAGTTKAIYLGFAY